MSENHDTYLTFLGCKASKMEPQATKYTRMGTYVHEKEIAKCF